MPNSISVSERIVLEMFKDKTLLITGGTGSFGNAVLNRFLKMDIKESNSILEMLGIYKV